MRKKVFGLDGYSMIFFEDFQENNGGFGVQEIFCNGHLNACNDQY